MSLSNAYQAAHSWEDHFSVALLCGLWPPALLLQPARLHVRSSCHRVLTPSLPQGTPSTWGRSAASLSHGGQEGGSPASCKWLCLFWAGDSHLEPEKEAWKPILSAATKKVQLPTWKRTRPGHWGRDRSQPGSGWRGSLCSLQVHTPKFNAPLRFQWTFWMFCVFL